jgi:hypothetical protein
MCIARALGQSFPMRLPCQALVAGVDIDEAAITAFVAAEDANGELSCHCCCVRPPPSLIAPPPLNLRHLKKLIVICFFAVAVAAAAVARLDRIDPEEELIVGLDELAITGLNAGRDGEDAPVDRDDAADEDSIDGLRLMGRRLHRFDVLEDLFDNFTGEVEWGNEDYDHNPQFENNGQYAPIDD